MYSIEFTAESYKALRKVPNDLLKLINKKLLLLSANPFAPNNNIKKLTNRPHFRLRVGDYRIIYKLDNTKLVIVVIKIGHRKEAYHE